jgi:hypothetical protein
MGQSSWAHKVYGGVQLIRACNDWPKWLREYSGGGANDGVERHRSDFSQRAKESASTASQNFNGVSSTPNSQYGGFAGSSSVGRISRSAFRWSPPLCSTK